MEELFIDTEQELKNLCQQVEKSEVIAIDTEFLREKTFYAQLCLLQIATEDVIACIDPLAISTLDPLFELFYQPNRIKILHSARQDLEIFFDLRGEIPTPIFDTQIAATLLGYGDQIGYANLVTDMLGITIDKDYARTDWTRRPLEAAQLQYAMNDVRYLITMYHQQVQLLTQTGRETWLQEDFAKLADINLYSPKPEQLWTRIKATKNLKRSQLVVLQQLAIWREQTARQANRPRKWIVSDDVLLDVARRSPHTVADLEKIHGWNNQIRKFTDDILKAVEQAKTIPESRWPSKKSISKLSPEQEAVVDLLMAVVKACAMENAVTSTLLATRKDLELLVAGNREASICSGWRFELAGKKLIQMLNGELSVTVHGDKLNILENKP